MDAIAHATMIIGWYEHLTEAEIPPAWMWPLNDELERHFEQVKADRRAGQPTTGDEEIEGPVIQNELARTRGNRAR